MAVYVSLIPKYKFSPAKRFLVKPNAKLSNKWPCIPGWVSAQEGFGWQEAESNETALLASAVPGGADGLGHLLWAFPCLRQHQGQLPRAFPHLLACHCLRRGTLGPAHSPGKLWRWLFVMPKSWADDISVSRSCGARDVNDGESRASSVPLSVVFYCSAAHAPGKGAELTLVWVQSAAFWCYCSSSFWGSWRFF